MTTPKDQEELDRCPFCGLKPNLIKGRQYKAERRACFEHRRHLEKVQV